MRTQWRVYIGGLEETDLLELGGRWGTVLNAEVCRNAAGRSKGFGWVDMATREESLAVVDGIQALNSKLTATVLNPPEIREQELLKWPPESRYGAVTPVNRKPSTGNLDFNPIEDFGKDS